MYSKISFLPFLGVLFVFVFPLTLSAQNDGNPYVPQRNPDRINLTVTEDPSTSAAVTWRTSTEIDEAHAEIVEDGANPAIIEKAKRFTALTETVTAGKGGINDRSEEHTSELQSRGHLVCRLLLEKKK